MLTDVTNHGKSKRMEEKLEEQCNIKRNILKLVEQEEPIPTQI